jgi:hypothetical protein
LFTSKILMVRKVDEEKKRCQYEKKINIVRMLNVFEKKETFSNILVKYLKEYNSL